MIINIYFHLSIANSVLLNKKKFSLILQ